MSKIKDKPKVYRQASVDEIHAGDAFIYKGPFHNLCDHELKFDAQAEELIDPLTPDRLWRADKFGQSFVDTDKYAALRARQEEGDFTSPGFRIFNHKYGYQQILFSECRIEVKEVASA